MAGIFKTFSHKLKPKQIHGLCGLDGPTGKPEGAIQYVPQGPGIGKKFDLEKQPLTPELKAKGISEEDYAAICELLRTAFGLTGIDGSFSKAITKANEEYFEKVGCVACYAEYYKGCKAMVVFTKEAADGGAVEYMK